MSPSYQTGVAAAAAALLVFTLPSVWRLRNIPVAISVAWLFVLNVVYIVNSAIWNGNVGIVATGYCDVAVKLWIGTTYVLPLVALCICRRLKLASARREAFNVRDSPLFEALLCLGVTLFFMALHCIIQGHRYDLVEDFGCVPSVKFSALSVVLVWVIPICIYLSAFVLAGFALLNYMRNRAGFNLKVLNLQPTGAETVNNDMSPQRFMRLISFALVQSTWGLTLAVVSLWGSASSSSITCGIPGIDLSRVDTFGLEFIPSTALMLLELAWWSVPVSSFLLFLIITEFEIIPLACDSVFRVMRRRLGRKQKRSASLPTFRAKAPQPIIIPVFNTFLTADKKDDFLNSPACSEITLAKYAPADITNESDNITRFVPTHPRRPQPTQEAFPSSISSQCDTILVDRPFQPPPQTQFSVPTVILSDPTEPLNGILMTIETTQHCDGV